LKSDVQVLAESLEAFAKEMKELTGIDPTIECVTIASTAFKVWQKMFLERNLIALERMAKELAESKCGSAPVARI